MSKPPFDLEALLREARPGARITIPAGRFKLSRPLVFSHNVTLIGGGAKRTVLVGASSGPLLTCKAGVALSHLAVERTGGQGDVILVASGTFSMTDVHVSGGKGTGKKGAGLRVRGSSKATIEDSSASRNTWDGFALEDDSVGTIRRCTATGNGNAGLQICEHAHGRVETLECDGNVVGFFVSEKGTADARGVDCQKNRMNGITVGYEATVQLAKCSGRRNKQNGMLISGKASCAVSASTFEDNGWHGVFSDTAGKCVVEGCSVARNVRGGIWAEERPTLLGNRVRANRSYGICVYEGKGAKVERNECTENRQAGIVIDASEAHVIRNTCTKNKGSGIFLLDAIAVVEANTCKNNGDGISVLDKGRTRKVTIRRNRCSANDRDGISIFEKATADVLENTCDGNDASGIGFYNHGGGVARGNRCSRNEEEGLESSSREAVLLAGNRATSNEGHGIYIYGHGAAHVTLDGNHASHNDGGAFDRPSLLRHFPMTTSSRFVRACEYWQLKGDEICLFSLRPEKALRGYPPAMARHFRPIGSCGEGSTLAFFLEKPDDVGAIKSGKAPIAFLGSEGVGHTFVARSFDEFLSLLAHGCKDLQQAIQYGLWKKPTKDSHFTELAAYLRDSLGVKPAAAPKKVIERAVAAHGDLMPWVREKLYRRAGVTKKKMQ